MASFINPSNRICSWNTGSWGFVVFFSLPLSSGDIAKLCSNLVGTGETKQKNNWRASGKLEFLWGKDLCCEAVRNPRALSQCVHFAIEGAMSFLWSRLYLDGQNTRGWRKPLRMITWVLCPAYSQKLALKIFKAVALLSVSNENKGDVTGRRAAKSKDRHCAREKFPMMFSCPQYN